MIGLVGWVIIAVGVNLVDLSHCEMPFVVCALRSILYFIIASRDLVQQDWVELVILHMFILLLSVEA